MELRNSEALGISRNGEVIVGHAGNKPVRWTADGGVDVLDFGEESYLTGVSADGAVIIGVSEGQHAFIWEEGLGRTPIGDLTRGDDAATFPLGISADGKTVVGYSGSDNGNRSISLDCARPESSRSTSRRTASAHSRSIDVNGDGSVVLGQGNIGDPLSLVFLWNEQHGMKSVRILLEEQGVDTTGWTFNEAIGI